MGPLAGLLLLLSVGQIPAEDWRMALPGWQFEFPRDHHLHADFKTEWWYFTGRLEDEKGDIFGYQVTFFRQGVCPPATRAHTTSRFIVGDVKFAHFALSDIREQRFHFTQKLNRGAFGEAGFSDSARLAWIENWTLELLPDGRFALQAGDEAGELQLLLRNAKPFAINGENGVSQKADGAGRASHYYSGTRLETTGTLEMTGKRLAVRGESWLDREWGSNQLAPNQVGWNWFSLQFDDGAEVMLYQLRTKDGGFDPNSSGTFVAQDGATQHLQRDDYQLTPAKFWTSKDTGGRYPIAWQLDVPKLNLRVEISTPLDSQELVLRPVAYWEGLVEVQGTHHGANVRGHGYMELTGYAGAVVGLVEPTKE